MLSYTRLKILLSSLIILLCLLLGGIFLYETQANVRDYKRQVFGVRQDYKVLQQAFAKYKEQTQNLRHLTIFASDASSKSVAVSNTMYAYSKKIPGDMSMYYKNLTTGESIVIDADKTYYMASLYKLILTLYLLEQVKSGTLTLDTPVQNGITLDTALNKILTESNNEYAQLLAERYGWAEIAKTIKQQYNIDFSFGSDLAMNVPNVGKLLESIATAIKLEDFESKYFLLFLQDQKHLSKLPKYLPANIYSHNKTGEFGNYSHDAGIFYTPKANYILIFMSKTNTPSATNEQMALMSKDIYAVLNDIK